MYQNRIIRISTYDEIEDMYEEVIISVNHETDLSMLDASRHIREIRLEPKLSLEEWPDVKVFPQ